EFGLKWRAWILGSLSSGKVSVLVNESLTFEFQFHCGLKQGDPLAPYLFILVMESLHLSFARIIEAGFFKGLNINNTVTISHLFYADDAVFVGEWSDSNLSCIMNVLHSFSLASGLKINTHKSHLLGVGVSHATIEDASASLGCSIMKSPFIYLGVPVGVFVKLSEGLNSSLRRPVRGGVESQQLSLLHDLVSLISLSNFEDRWVWNLNGSGLFRVCDICNMLDEKFRRKVEVATRWVKYIPMKINIFAWKVCLDRLPTRLNLAHRDVQVSSLDCLVCSLSHDPRPISYLVAPWLQIYSVSLDGGIWVGLRLVHMPNGCLGLRISEWVLFSNPF
nr:RNA-directed DNA polymerase, eukaryota [Tanacetum cinerariifolium]